MLRTGRLFFLLPLLLNLIFVTAEAQVTRVTGRIFDATNNEALPFVNIIFQGTTTGTTTDFDGYYTLTSTQPTDSIEVSFIGYVPITKAVKKGQSQEFNFELQPDAVNFQTIEVKAGPNPAHEIIRRVVANKEQNNKENLQAYQYEVYNKVEFDINNISEEFINSKLFKPFKFVFDNIDSSDASQKPFLPLFITESLSDFYYQKEPKRKKEVIKASKLSGVDNESVSQFMGDMYQNVNIYDNIVLVFGKNFVSPVSDRGMWFYEYYLIDSMYIDQDWCYQLRFKPKRKQELAFIGNLWIARPSYAIKRLEMKIVDDANINFVNGLNVIQEYKNVDDAWMLYKDKLVVDFTLQDRKMGVYGRKTTSYKDFVINRVKQDDFFSLGDNLVVLKDANKKEMNFWETARHDTLSHNEQKIYQMVDTIQSMPIYRTWVDVVTLILSGYKVAGNFEYGPYYKTLSFNQVEGTRFRFGGRTSNAFSKWYELSGHIAYGTKDKVFKYRAGIRSFITKKPRQMFGLYYTKDVEILGRSANAFSEDNMFASLLARNPLTNLTGYEEVMSYYEKEWFEGFQTKLSFVGRKMWPLGDLRYEFIDDDNTIEDREMITTSEVRFFTRFAYDEKYIAGEFERASMGTKYPILMFQYTMGVKDLFNGDFQYHKIKAKVDDRVRSGALGYTDYAVEVGKVWGVLPYPLMELHPGNETYTYDPYAYNMMNYYEFVSDQYLSIGAQHHFDGFFFNRVPLFRKLKFREVIHGKMLMGKANEDNKRVILFPQTLYNLNKGAYYEAGVGVENILRIFRVDAIWRLAYLDHPNIVKFGIRGAVQLQF